MRRGVFDSSIAQTPSDYLFLSVGPARCGATFRSALAAVPSTGGRSFFAARLARLSVTDTIGLLRFTTKPLWVRIAGRFGNGGVT